MSTLESNLFLGAPKICPIKWVRFQVPPHILEKPVKLPLVLKSKLASLPTELVLRILRLAKPEDAICLALTCRRVLQIAGMGGLKRPTVDSARASIHLSGGDLAFLSGFLQRLTPRDASGEPRGWVQLCSLCLRFQPTRAAMWVREAKAMYRHGNEGTRTHWNAMLGEWREGRTLKCPRCWFLETKWCFQAHRTRYGKDMLMG